MTSKIIFASKKLGTIHHNQLQAMLDRFNLGTLISSRKTELGAMGQTMFVSSTKGDFILKGNPLYHGQLEEEKFFIENIEKRTDTPVPIPYLIDKSSDIFGWSYALMPHLPGEHIDSKLLKNTLTKENKLQIAESIASTLTIFHKWKVADFGELHIETMKITPLKPTYTDWIFQRIMFWLEDAKKYSTITDEDIEWSRSLLAEAKEAFHSLDSPTFIMGDFKPGNFLVNSGESGWRISGVFDFTNSYFGDPVSDLIKMVTYYLNHNETGIAKHMLNKYFEGWSGRNFIKSRLKVHMLHQRVLDWGNGKATKTATWDDSISFSEWAAPYTELIASLVD